MLVGRLQCVWLEQSIVGKRKGAEIKLQRQQRPPAEVNRNATLYRWLQLLFVSALTTQNNAAMRPHRKFRKYLTSHTFTDLQTLIQKACT